MTTLIADDRVHAPTAQEAVLLHERQFVTHCEHGAMTNVKIRRTVVIVNIHVVCGTGRRPIKEQVADLIQGLGESIVGVERHAV